MGSDIYKPNQAYKDAKASCEKWSQGTATDQKKRIIAKEMDSIKKGLPAPPYYQQMLEGESCFICGSKEHKMNKCPKKGKIPKEQWAITKLNKIKGQFMQQQYCQYLELQWYLD